MRANAEVVAQALEVPIEVQNVDAHALSRRGYRQVGEGKAMGEP